jgi:hypothetical protein
MSADTGAVNPGPPNYEFPRLPLVGFGLDLLLGRRRSFLKDSRTVMAANPYRRQARGLENLPSEGPFVVVTNHYARRGLRTYHCALFITTVIAEQRPLSPAIRWIITSEWYGYRLGPIPVPVWLIRWIFRQIGKVYGHLVMPRQASRAVGRAAVLRRIARIARRESIGVTPEAGGSGMPLVPTAIWEEDDTLLVSFGEPFALSVAKEGPRQDQDRRAREQVMVAVGRLLPPDYWGHYSEAIQRSLSDG